MGFNLQCFMDELLSIVRNKNLNAQECEKLLCEVIERGHAYAKECGQIK